MNAPESAPGTAPEDAPTAPDGAPVAAPDNGNGNGRTHRLDEAALRRRTLAALSAARDRTALLTS